ncbi:hypothetical protein Y032_0439g1502 [Ancylostoma ceylanicum]|uniref:Uncharacterized protein n=1 Tax=Ancylostoma ceylanicum TaxID=53326 RepID=A0A016X0S4_9BILA|nr:hypothetical protein Y032_0439g1502 [Ancylostoma ceylanicum]
MHCYTCCDVAQSTHSVAGQLSGSSRTSLAPSRRQHQLQLQYPTASPPFSARVAPNETTRTHRHERRMLITERAIFRIWKQELWKLVLHYQSCMYVSMWMVPSISIKC